MPGSRPTVLLYNSAKLRAEINAADLRETSARIRNGCCVMCGVPVLECWCGEYDPLDERPVAGSDWEPVE